MPFPRTSSPRYYRPYSSHPYYRYSYPRYSYYSPWYYRPYSWSLGFGIGFGFSGGYWGGYGYPYGYSYGYPSSPYPYPYGSAYPNAYVYPNAYAYPNTYAYPSTYPSTYTYPSYAYDSPASARLLITPPNAEVYVDGRFVGLVDEFDGSSQRLTIESGRHDIQVALQGYRPLTQRVMFSRGSTLTISGALQPLRSGETAEAAPAQDPATRPEDSYQAQRPAQTYPREQAGFGTLSIRVNPPDAVILIDGEVWDRPAGETRFSIELAEGPHQVEIRKEGYRSYARTVDVLGARSFTLNVSLSPGASGQRLIGARPSAVASTLRRP